MKINKFLIAAMAATTLFASCTKEEVSNENGDKVLTISLSNPTSKAIGAPGSSQVATIANGDGIIFILDASGNVKQSVEFAGTFPTTPQVITGVAASDQVYVIANIGTTNKAAWIGASKPTTLTAIKALNMSIADATYGQVYTTATIANATGAPVDIILGAGATATVNVTVKPVYSRLELPSITGSGTISDFTVTGVYVDDYYSNYTMGQSYSGAIFQQLKNPTVFSQITEMKNEGTWVASSKIAKPNATTDRWVYNVPAGNMPRLIIKLTNVVGTWTGGGGAISTSQTFFLTIKGYNSVTTTTFAPGMIYTINNGITFNQDNLGTTPNAESVALTVTLANTPWAVGVLTADLM